MTYALFADGQADADDFGATHPAVQARARWGRRVMDLTAGVGGTGTTHRKHLYRPSNGG